MMERGSRAHFHAVRPQSTEVQHKNWTQAGSSQIVDSSNPVGLPAPTGTWKCLQFHCLQTLAESAMPDLGFVKLFKPQIPGLHIAEYVY